MSLFPKEQSVSILPIDWLDWHTYFIFFTGKGGVGKTTIASTVALQLAEAGQRILLVSTDPASNLGDVFAMQTGPLPTAVSGVHGLSIMDLDPEAAAAAYRERVIGPYRGLLPPSALRSMEEQLSGACTVEIAAFHEFTRLLADEPFIAQFDHILFDTAPTGHTLRLLSLPGAWSGYIETSSHGASCLGPLAGLEAQQERYLATVRALADETRTTIVLVSRPEESALREVERTSVELHALQMTHQQLILNGVLPATTEDDATALAMMQRQQQALLTIPEVFRSAPLVAVPLVASHLTGIAALRSLASATSVQQTSSESERSLTDLEVSTFQPFDDLLHHIIQDGHGIVMMMGKGGVGKTTLAAALAVALARCGYPVHLSTTDPAAHLLQTLGTEIPAGLSVHRIDPVVEVQRYTEEVLAEAGSLDEEGRAFLEEDLRSPCTEEIAVFRAFARTVHAAEHEFVVLDTAPTGHTLLLLDAAEHYHREVMRTTGKVPEAVRTLLPHVRDPISTKVLLVTLAESTPMQEAERLQVDLRRAGIEPFGWIINASLFASDTTHPLLMQRAHLEGSYIHRIAQELASSTWLVPWHAQILTGERALCSLVGQEPV
jgi:arsenite-transporting ATPase